MENTMTPLARALLQHQPLECEGGTFATISSGGDGPEMIFCTFHHIIDERKIEKNDRPLAQNWTIDTFLICDFFGNLICFTSLFFATTTTTKLFCQFRPRVQGRLKVFLSGLHHLSLRLSRELTSEHFNLFRIEMIHFFLHFIIWGRERKWSMWSGGSVALQWIDVD